jgi:LemA protein
VAIDQSFVDATDLFARAVATANFALDNWWLWPLAGLVLWTGFALRDQHALLSKLDERADAAFGDVDALLMERHGLVGNLAQVVRAFTKHERAVIGDVLDTRVATVEALVGTTGMAIDTQFAAAINNLFSVAEAYPTLTSEAQYRTLRQDLIRVEERITAARKFYNLSVEEANAVRRSFPANLLAFGMPAREKFSVGERRAELSEPVRLEI